MNWLTYRTIKEETIASASLEKLSSKYERFDDQWLGFTWFLCRMPEKSLRNPIDGVTYRLMHRAGDTEFDLVDIAAVFTFDDHEIHLFDVQAWEVEDD